MSDESGKYAYEGLDRVLHEKARLSILTSLFAHPKGLKFKEIRDLCSLTDGNLSRHMQVLEREGLLKVKKRFVKSKPQTSCVMTPDGRERFREYIAELQAVVEATTIAEQQLRPET